MAKVGTLKKQPQEVLSFTLSYADVLAGNTATSITPVVTSTPSGLDVTGVAVVGNVLQALVGAGLDGISYVITARTTLLVAGKTLVVEDEVTVRVKEVA